MGNCLNSKSVGKKQTSKKLNDIENKTENLQENDSSVRKLYEEADHADDSFCIDQ